MLVGAILVGIFAIAGGVGLIIHAFEQGLKIPADQGVAMVAGGAFILACGCLAVVFSIASLGRT